MLIFSSTGVFRLIFRGRRAPYDLLAIFPLFVFLSPLPIACLIIPPNLGIFAGSVKCVKLPVPE